MTELQAIQHTELTSRAEAVKQLFAASMSDSTRRAYTGHCKRFQEWAEREGMAAFPAAPFTLSLYIAYLADEGRSASTISQAVSAISAAHEARGGKSPSDHTDVKRALAGARRVVGESVSKKTAATAQVILSMLNSMTGGTLKEKRDRALLALGFAGAFRRSELVALEVGDIEEGPEGAIVTIRKSKTDQTSKGQTIGIPYGQYIQPIKLVREWLEASGITEGPIFQRMNRHGQLLGPMGSQSVALVVKERAKAIGMDASLFAGHSLRSGFITSGVEAGADALAISEVSRHRNLDVLRGYVRKSNLLRNHFGSRFL